MLRTVQLRFQEFFFHRQILKNACGCVRKCLFWNAGSEFEFLRFLSRFKSAINDWYFIEFEPQVNKISYNSEFVLNLQLLKIIEDSSIGWRSFNPTNKRGIGFQKVHHDCQLFALVYKLQFKVTSTDYKSTCDVCNTEIEFLIPEKISFHQP